MNFHHLPGKAGAEIAGVAIHYTNQSCNVVRQLRAAAVSFVVDKAEVIFKADSRANRDGRGQKLGKALVCRIESRVIGNKECAPVEEQAFRRSSPADDRNRVRAMSILGPRLGKMLGPLLYVPKRLLRSCVGRGGFETSRTLMRIQGASTIERRARCRKAFRNCSGIDSRSKYSMSSLQVS